MKTSFEYDDALTAVKHDKDVEYRLPKVTNKKEVKQLAYYILKLNKLQYLRLLSIDEDSYSYPQVCLLGETCKRSKSPTHEDNKDSNTRIKVVKGNVKKVKDTPILIDVTVTEDEILDNKTSENCNISDVIPITEESII